MDDVEISECPGTGQITTVKIWGTESLLLTKENNQTRQMHMYLEPCTLGACVCILYMCTRVDLIKEKEVSG